MNKKEKIIAELKKLTKNNFDETSNIEALGIDSLDLVELVTAAEEEFDMEISDEKLMELKTVDDIFQAFEA